MTAVSTAAAAARDGTGATRHGSLERRLMVRLGLLYVAAILIVSAVYVTLAWSNRHIEVEAGAELAAIDLANAVTRNADGAPRLNLTPALREMVARYGDAGVTVIDQATGVPVAGVPEIDAAPLPVNRDFTGKDIDFFVRGASGRTLYGTMRAVETSSGRYWVSLLNRRKVSHEAREWIRGELGYETLSVMVPLLAATLLTAWLTLRTSLRPLRRLAEEAQRVTPYVAGTRLSRDHLPREIVPVVAAANGALDRVEAALTQQRRLMANIAHELRTPLAILRARIESLADAITLATLLPDFDRVSRLVDRLLAVARLQSENMQFDKEYELVRAVREALAQMAPLALAQRKELALQAPETPIMVRGNPDALEDALRNLVDNALRFTAPGETVELTVTPGASVEVRDRGPGIASDHAANLFEPFWRGGEHGHGRGTGLGLAIAAETARRHDGRLTVTNAESGGAVFRMEIPELA